MTHLLDTSVLHKYPHFVGVAKAVNQLNENGAVFSTCPPVIAEFCFSAQTPEQLAQFQSKMRSLLLLESGALAPLVELAQKAMWAQGLVRAAGAIDTITAAYAMHARHTLVTCDTDHVHIARAVQKHATRAQLKVIYLSEGGKSTVIG